MKFVVDQDQCVGCLACARVCPTRAIAVPAEVSTVSIIEESCIRCGLCLPACPHDAIDAVGALETALRLTGRTDAVLIVGTEAPAHFYPATAEQVLNACYAAGFHGVSRGVAGDELVAAEYERLWAEEGWGTMIRSTDPVAVGAVVMGHPELLPYLAPIATPPVAEARYLRRLYGPDLKVVYAGVWPLDGERELDAVITFEDLAELFRRRGVDVLSQPGTFRRVPMERRRHRSVAGGLPLSWVEGPNGGPRLRRLRGLEGLDALSRAVARDRLDLGFVDLQSCEGVLDHPVAGPKAELYWRRSVVQLSEPPRSPVPVVEAGTGVELGAVFSFRSPAAPPDPLVVRSVIDRIGTGPSGRPWDCGACGYATCEAFAGAVAVGRSSLRLCPPYLARWAEESQDAAATDTLTGLATFSVLRDRKAEEIERSKRSLERFAVLFLDLDHLKALNDTSGHEAGNTVLREVGREIRSVVRASDLAARYGGDEFVVILPRTDRPGATRVAEALREGVERVGERFDHGQGPVTVSIGIAEFDPGDPDAGDPLEAADQAMYRAKALGRNRWSW